METSQNYFEQNDTLATSIDQKLDSLPDNLLWYCSEQIDETYSNLDTSDTQEYCTNINQVCTNQWANKWVDFPKIYAKMVV